MYQVSASVNRELIGKTEDELMDLFECSDEGIEATCDSSDKFIEAFGHWLKSQGIVVCRL